MPRVSDKTIKQTNVKYPESISDSVKQIAKLTGKTATAIYIEAIQEYIQKFNARICSSCNTPNPEKANFCFNCGQPLSAETQAEFEKIVDYIKSNPAVILHNLNINKP